METLTANLYLSGFRGRGIQHVKTSCVKRLTGQSTWHATWNASEICWIYSTYSSEKETVQSVWKMKAPIKSWRGFIGRSFCQSHSKPNNQIFYCQSSLASLTSLQANSSKLPIGVKGELTCEFWNASVFFFSKLLPKPVEGKWKAFSVILCLSFKVKMPSSPY